MSTFDEFMLTQARYQARLTEATAENRSRVFAALRQAGITKVKIEFDGCGDSGGLTDVIADAGETRVELPKLPVTLQRVRYSEGTLFEAEHFLPEALELLCFDFLELHHPGWEIDEGSDGTFCFDVAANTLALEFNANVVEVVTTEHEL